MRRETRKLVSYLLAGVLVLLAYGVLCAALVLAFLGQLEAVAACGKLILILLLGTGAELWALR